MINFLIITSEFPPGPGGIGQHAASFAGAISKKGKVVVLTNQDYTSYDEIKIYNENNSTCFEIIPFVKRNSKLTSIQRINQALNLVKRYHPNRIFVSGRFPLWVGAIIKTRFPQLRVEGFVHGSEVTLTGSILSKITKKAYLKLDRIIAVSTFTRSLLHKSVKEKKVLVVPNGLDSELLRINKDEEYQPFDWKGNPKILTVGNISPRKGQHRVVAALPEIVKKFPGVHYHVVGLPTNGIQLKLQAKQLGVSNHLTVHGRMASRKDLYCCFCSADIFIMLSENQKDGDIEGFGIAILEANAFGLTSIGATGCGIEDAIDKTSGILVDGDNIEQIVKAIDNVLENRVSFNAGARMWAEQHNWDTLIKKIINIK